MRWMVEVRQFGGMVKHIGMGELNALPFFAFVRYAHNAENYENCGVCVAAEGAHT